MERAITLYIFILSLLNSATLSAQILEPVKWEYSWEKEREGNIIKLKFTANIDEDWYIYSSDQDPDIGPSPMTLVIYDGKDSDMEFSLKGKFVTEKVQEKFDAIWMGEVRYVKGTASFYQLIEISEHPVQLNGHISYQVCSTIDGKCVLGEEDFEVTISE